MEFLSVMRHNFILTSQRMLLVYTYKHTSRYSNGRPRINEPLSILEISLSNFDIYTCCTDAYVVLCRELFNDVTLKAGGFERLVWIVGERLK